MTKTVLEVDPSLTREALDKEVRKIRRRARYYVEVFRAAEEEDRLAKGKVCVTSEKARKKHKGK